MRARKTFAAVVASAALLLTSCGEFTGIYDLPLPGGADVGDDPIELKVQFRDVLDLVPQTHVKVNEVPVGRVDKVELAEDAWHAEVTILLNRSADLPANASANIKMSSLLGEKYIELVHPPNGSAQGKLDDGSVIPLSRTNRNVEIEEILGALSALLNGGGVEQINVITKELNKTLTGNEPELKALLRNTDTLMTGLNGQTGEIDKALRSLNRLAKTLDKDKEVISKALDDLSPGMKVLIDQRKDLTRVLQSLRKLSTVATDTMQRSKADTIENLKSLQPILHNIANSKDLTDALELLVSFPFPDAAVEGVRGDYFNLYSRLSLDVEEIIANFQRNSGHPMPGVPIVKELPAGEGEVFDPSAFPSVDVPEQFDGSGAVDLLDTLTGGLVGGDG